MNGAPARNQEYPSLSIQEIFRLADDDVQGKRICVLTKAYIDDSQDGKLEHFVQMTAILGIQDDWQRISRSWKKCLRTPPTIDYFKSREHRNLDKEFFQFRKLPEGMGRIEADKKRAALVDVIQESDVQLFVCAIPLSAYQTFRSLHPEAARLFCPDPLEQAFIGLLSILCRYVLDAPGKNHISFVYDEDLNRKNRLKEQYEAFKRKNPVSAKIMRSFAQLDDQHNPPLQMADLAANVATGVLRKALPIWDGQTKRSDPMPELEGTFNCVRIYDEEFMAKVLTGNKGPDLRSQIRKGSIQFQPIKRA